MKALILIATLLTLGIFSGQYKRDKKLKKLLISLATFAFIISLAIVGNITRSIIPLFITHEALVVVAWGALLIYVFKEKYQWWWFLSPLLTIVLFLVLEFLGGSAHELI
jgi:hypothetical protein